MIAEFFPLFYFYSTVKLYPPPMKNCQVFALNLCKIIYFFSTIPLFTYTKCEFCIFFSFFTFSLQNLNLYHSPHTSPLKYKNSLSHLNTGRSYAFPSLYKMQKESFHMLYYFRFFFINNKSLNSSKAISFPALFKRTASNTSE